MLYQIIMSVQNITDDIMPVVAKTEDEYRRWNALPRDARTARLSQTIGAGLKGTPSKRGVDGRFSVSSRAEQDLTLIRNRRPEQDMRDFYESFRLITDSPELGMPIKRGTFDCQRFRMESYDIYYRREDDDIVIGRILDQYRIRRRSSGAGELP